LPCSGQLGDVELYSRVLLTRPPPERTVASSVTFAQGACQLACGLSRTLWFSDVQPSAVSLQLCPSIHPCFLCSETSCFYDSISVRSSSAAAPLGCFGASKNCRYTTYYPPKLRRALWCRCCTFIPPKNSHLCVPSNIFMRRAVSLTASLSIPMLKHACKASARLRAQILRLIGSESFRDGDGIKRQHTPGCHSIFTVLRVLIQRVPTHISKILPRMYLHRSTKVEGSYFPTISSFPCFYLLVCCKYMSVASQKLTSAPPIFSTFTT
jgi:hypothetical protein